MKNNYRLKFVASAFLAFMGYLNVNAQCVTPPTPAITNPTICIGDSAVMSATGASSLITGWYASSFGGNAIATGSMYTTPSLSTTTVYYVAQLAPAGAASLSMPAQTTSFSGNVRGYWFIAPTSFMITGLNVPTDASTGLQNIAVLKLPTTPPVYSSTTSVFDVLYLTQNNPTSGTISVNIPVYSGDVIGVLGNRNDINSYASVAPYTSNLGTYTTTLNRFGMQYNLSSTPPQAVWTETTSGSSISRVEMFTTLGCLNSLTSATVTMGSCTTGINELNETALQVYPNPSKGNVNVNLADYSGSPVTIQIFDVLGKTVFITELPAAQNSFDISYLANGVYTYKLSNKESSIKVGKLVKE